MDTEEHVHEVMEQVISRQADVSIDERQLDIDERESVMVMTRDMWLPKRMWFSTLLFTVLM